MSQVKLSFSEELWDTGLYQCYSNNGTEIITILSTTIQSDFPVAVVYKSGIVECVTQFRQTDLYLVKKPVNKEYFINVYRSSLGAAKNTYSSAKDASASSSISCIKLTISETGEFIKGENV